MATMTLEGLYIGTPRELAGVRGPWTSSFGRRPVPGRIAVAPGGIVGDGVSDEVHHGGPDRVLLAYAAAHYPAWRADVADHAFVAPAFGENLLVAGADEDSVCIGDVWQVGGARLQVSMPRWPCGKIALYNGVPDLLGRVMTTGRFGWLLRVLEEGQLGAGDAIELLERPHPDWPVARAFRVFRDLKSPSPERAADARALADLAGLAAAWRGHIAERLASLAASPG